MDMARTKMRIDDLTMGELEEATGSPVVVALYYRSRMWSASVCPKVPLWQTVPVPVEWTSEDLGVAVEQAVVEFLGRAHALRLARAARA